VKPVVIEVVSIASEKVAVMVVLTIISSALLSGDVELTVGATVSVGLGVVVGGLVVG
jgi:hypothetical protein